MSQTTKSLFITLLLCCGFSLLIAQEVFIEHHASGTDFVALIPRKLFIFDRRDSQTEYQVSMEVKDSKKKTVARHEQRLFLTDRSDLAEAAVMVRFTESLAAGNYELSMIVKNSKLGDRRNLRKQFEISIKSIDIGHAYLIGSLQGISYVLSTLKQFEVNFDRIYISQNISIPLDSMKISIDGENKVIPNPAISNVFDIEAGSKVPNSIELTYYEANIRYHSEPFLFGSWYGYGSIYSYKDQIAQIRYIATQNEWNSLRRIPGSGLKAAIEDFWDKHDPSPGTLRNEAREEFYKRVLLADERYSLHARLKGWRSDRGRIYIKYGDPDEINSEVHPLDSPPYIVWHYYSLGKRFVFFDQKGYGDYTLENQNEEYDEF